MDTLRSAGIPELDQHLMFQLNNCALKLMFAIVPVVIVALEDCFHFPCISCSDVFVRAFNLYTLYKAYTWHRSKFAQVKIFNLDISVIE